MIELNVEGRKAFAVYLTVEFEPTSQEEAKIIKLIFKDGSGVVFLHVGNEEDFALPYDTNDEDFELEEEDHFAWDDSAHPRHPSGSSQGGEFAPKGGVAGVASKGKASPQPSWWVMEEKELNDIAKRIPHMKGANLKPEWQDQTSSGVNTSGFITIKGKKYFIKEAGNYKERENEVAAWQAAKALEWTDFVTPVRAVKYKGEDYLISSLLPRGNSLVSQTAGRKTPNIDFSSERTKRMFLFEYIIGAGDRHAGNYWLESNGTPWSIDHGRSFNNYKYISQNLYRDWPTISKDQKKPGLTGGSWNSLWTYAATNSGLVSGGVSRKEKVFESVPRKLVEHIVSKKDQLIAISKRTKGWDRNSTKGMRNRFKILESALRDQEGPNVSLPW